jgi:nondiscriminating aspartyl-tRNA synthetase
MLHDCSGEVQCVAASEELKALQLKLEDTVEIYGRVRADARSNGVMRSIFSKRRS